jgi:hypothetical protein
MQSTPGKLGHDGVKDDKMMVDAQTFYKSPELNSQKRLQFTNTNIAKEDKISGEETWRSEDSDDSLDFSEKVRRIQEGLGDASQSSSKKISGGEEQNYVMMKMDSKPNIPNMDGILEKRKCDTKSSGMIPACHHLILML